MEELVAAMRIVLANTFVMYFRSHSYHWNVEGVEFSQYHEFFGDLYTDVYESVDPIAELLRKLDEYAPVSLDELFKYKTLQEETTRVVLLADILAKLIAANEEVLSSLNKVFEIANKNKQQGICNFIADRIDTHQKHGWFLKASAKKVG